MPARDTDRPSIIPRRLLFEPVADAGVAFDVGEGKAYRLSEQAWTLVQACDGSSSIPELAAGTEPGVLREVLADLSAAGLISLPGSPEPRPAGGHVTALEAPPAARVEYETWSPPDD